MGRYFPTGKGKGADCLPREWRACGLQSRGEKKKSNKCSAFVVTLCGFIEEWLDENISEPVTVLKSLARKNRFKRAVGLCHSQAPCQILYWHAARLREVWSMGWPSLGILSFLPPTLAEVIAYMYILFNIRIFWAAFSFPLSHFKIFSCPRRTS